jgi:hypothetical protein
MQTPEPFSSIEARLQRPHWRAVVVGLILIPVNCYWITYIELVQNFAHPTTVSLIFTVVFNVFVLTLLNLLGKRFFPRLALSQGELLVIYAMLSVASAVAGHSFMEILVSILGHAFWFATPENDWNALFLRYIPKWLSMADKRVLSGYYQGDSTLYTAQHLLGWLTPVMSWFAFVFALLLVMVCINLIVRKPWTKQEKLAYPIIQLPFALTGEGFLNNKTLWVGFGLAASLDTINGLHFIFPAIPRLFARSYFFSFAEPPWSTMGRVILGIYPFALGIGFLIPSSLLFSCCFFFWVWKAQLLLGGIMGWQTSAGFGGTSYPYVNYQGFGAYLGIFLIALVRSRKHFFEVFRKFVGRGSALSDRNEPIPYRVTFLILILGVAFLVLFCLKAGMDLWAITIFFALYFAVSTAISRLRAELGAPMHDLHYTGPEQVTVAATGTRALGSGNLLMFSFFWFFTRTFDSHPMPHQLEGFKLAERARIKSDFFLFALLIAIVAGILSGFWAFLSIPYRLGVVHRMSRVPLIYGQEPWSHLQRWLLNPAEPNYGAVGFVAIGLLAAIFLMAMRMKFLWWPFHEAAYAAVSGSYAITHIWFSLLLAWVAKLLLLKYGGLHAYRKATPFFLGLILGQFIVGSFWTIVGMFFNIPTFGQYMPYYGR